MQEFSGNQATERRRSGSSGAAARFFAGALIAFALVDTPVQASGGGGGGDTKVEQPKVPPPGPPRPKPEPRPRPPMPPPISFDPIPPRVPSVVVDVNTGLALDGFDPVAYFVDGRPREGKADFELDWGGATWRFVNEGNMLAFKDAPDVYTPAFSGRCPFQLARGFAAEGSPLVFLVRDNRLFLFVNPATRVAFLVDPDKEIAAAEGNWAALAQNLP